MKLVSWNVNGIRAVHKRGDFLKVFKLKPDILFLQETKATADQVPEDARNIPGYHSFFASSNTKKGYSGVALYTKEKPLEVRYGMGLADYDDEGRQITAIYKDFVAIGVYFPNGGRGPDRLAYKMGYYDAFLAYIDSLRKEYPHLVFCGDVNTAHEEIDLARPKENSNTTGFLPEEREWLDEVVRHGYVDSFRHVFPAATGAYSYWDTLTRARERNVGWRIDYFFITRELQKHLKDAKIHSDIFGSDHCPVSVELNI